MVKNWILQNILESISEFSQQLIAAFGSFFDNIFIAVADFNNGMTQGITYFSIAFAVAFTILLCVKQYFSVYVLETQGDPDSDPLDIFVRGSEAIAVIVCSDYIFEFMLDFSRVFVEDFQNFHVDNVGESGSSSMMESLSQLLQVPTRLASISSVIIIITVGLLIALIVFSISAGIRGAELILMKMLFPIFACDMVTTQRERWNSFFASYLVTWVAYGLQIVSFRMFNVTLSTFVVADLNDFPKLVTITLGWLVMMIRAPHWLEKFAYNSGISSGLRNGIYLLSAGARIAR